MKIDTRSLREQVYDYLRKKINEGEIKGGEIINLEKISKSLGVSRTPLRDALIKLESDGFVEIKSRKGIVVKSLSLKDIKDYYQIIGALECSILMDVGHVLKKEDIRNMEILNAQMKNALDEGDFNKYYDLNLRFHNTYLNLSDNEIALNMITIARQRLYDFPRRKDYVPDWEYNSLAEHAEIVSLLKKNEFEKAGLYLKDVHWSFDVQRKYILRYYPEAVDRLDK